jgi:hypothetical protein
MEPLEEPRKHAGKESLWAAIVYVALVGAMLGVALAGHPFGWWWLLAPIWAGLAAHSLIRWRRRSA